MSKNPLSSHPAPLAPFLFEKLRDREAKVAVIGRGYVGLLLAVETAQAGFKTTGIDIADELSILEL